MNTPKNIAQTHRKLGVGERITWGDIYFSAMNTSWLGTPASLIGSLVREDDDVEFYRPLGMDTPPDTLAFSTPPRTAHVPPPVQHSTDGKALTYDDGKPALAVLPTAALREMSKVQAYGKRKYNDFYNYKKGMELSRNLSCALRHIYEVMDGNDTDPESGCHHLGHAMTRLAFVMQNIADGTLIDDRFKPAK